MARLLAALCIVLGLSPAVAADRAETLLAAKVEYLEQIAAARRTYLQAIDREADRLQSAGDEDRASELRTHRGALLLGDISAEEYRQFEAEGLDPAHLVAVDAYVSACAECRKTLADTYQRIIDAAEFIKSMDEAADYRAELESFQDGEYIPTAVEVIKPKPYEIRRVQLKPPTILPATAAKIADVLSVEFRDPGFVIYGTRQIDLQVADGGRQGHFGKGVVVAAAPGATKKMRGYLMIGAIAEEGTYSIFTANRTKMKTVMPLEDLELDTVYEWSVEFVRSDYKFELRRDGEVIKSETTLGGPGTVFGFCATLRYEDTEARLAVAVE